MRIFLQVAAWFCLVLSASQGMLAGEGQTYREDRGDRISKINQAALKNIPLRMKEFVEAGKTAGVVTLLAHNGQVVSFEATGYQDLEAKTPMRKDSLFRIASLTKPITCAGIMVLVDQGRLSVIDPVEKYLPEYKGIKVAACDGRALYGCDAVAPSRPINIEDLMTHTSGLRPSADPGEEKPKTLAELAGSGARTQLLFEPGTRWSYSNIGYDILGRIIEVISKEPFDRFLQENIFAPLEMGDTSFGVPPQKKERLASLYSYGKEGLKAVKAEWGAADPGGIPSPAGGLVSSANDLLRFNEMMRNGGTLGGRRILSEAAVQLMTTSHTGNLKAGWVPGAGHGYGYEVVREPAGMYRYNSIGSFMKGGAYRTYEWVDSRKGLTGVILMQRTNGGGDTADEINSFVQISGAAVLQLGEEKGAR